MAEVVDLEQSLQPVRSGPGRVQSCVIHQDVEAIVLNREQLNEV